MATKKSKHAPHVLENIRWFAQHRHDFDFSGSASYFLKKVLIYKQPIEGGESEFVNSMAHASFCDAFGHNPKHSWLPQFTPGEKSKYSYYCVPEVEMCVEHDVNGVSGVDAFVQIDSYGVVKPTRHPTLLFNLLRTKASLNLHIQMYAQDRANGRLPKLLFDELAQEFSFRPWMIEAVENQKWNYYK